MKRWIISLVFVLMFASLVFAEGENLFPEPERIGTLEKSVCCEKTKAGLFCQDANEDDCNTNFDIMQTSCDSTAFCKPGWCYDSFEGTCLDHTSELVCDESGGEWSEEKPAACDLGCCVLGDQASFVTLVRCKRLSSFLGLETNFNPELNNEVMCILSAQADEKGACVYVEDFERTCEFTTRGECETNEEEIAQPETEEVEEEGEEEEVEGGELTGNVITGYAITQQEEEQLEAGGVVFFPGMLCSAEELGTNCAPTEETMCLPGKEEVYYVDSCGNPANIYDASKVKDANYWSRIINRDDSCNSNSANILSQTCGNCNYILGSICRESNEETGPVTYGNNVCADLNCVDSNGTTRMHGESWCVQDEGFGKRVGSRAFKMICNNGEVVPEPCADFRQEICIEETAETSQGPYSQAACRVNRWQDCTAQITATDCLNGDRRDCKWLIGKEYMIVGRGTGGGGEGEGSSGVSSLQEMNAAVRETGVVAGACVPEFAPGFDFWSTQEIEDGQGNEQGSASEAEALCAQANGVCPVKYEKGIVGGGWECVDRCECLDETGPLALKRIQLCRSMGDCGPKMNIEGVLGIGKGFKVIEKDGDDDE